MTNGHNAQVPGAGNYASVNGLNMYYEIHGTGQPLVVLHGAYMTIETMGEILPSLAEIRRVIAVELQGHGHTADVDRPLTYEQMADDVAALIGYLGIDKADVFGYSMGGGVALQAAVRHPEVVRTRRAPRHHALRPLRRWGLGPRRLAGCDDGRVSQRAHAGGRTRRGRMK